MSAQSQDPWIQLITDDRYVAFGSAMMGVIADGIILGVVLCLWLYWWSHRTGNEKWVHTALGIWMLISSVGHSAYNYAFALSLFVYSDESFDTFVYSQWLKGLYMNEMLLVIPVEIFYSHRCWVLWGHSKILAFLFSSLITLFVVLVLVIVATYQSNFFTMTRGPIFLTAASSLWVLDWGISALMILGLRRMESHFMTTQRLLRRMIILSAEAQIIPSLALVAYLLRAIIAPSSTVTYFFMFAPKIWVATALVVFISRQGMQSDMEEERQRREMNFTHGIIDQPRIDMSGRRYTAEGSMIARRSTHSSQARNSRPSPTENHFAMHSISGDDRSTPKSTESSGPTADLENGNHINGFGGGVGGGGHRLAVEMPQAPSTAYRRHSVTPLGVVEEAREKNDGTATLAEMLYSKV